jgi:hypothetical protein
MEMNSYEWYTYQETIDKNSPKEPAISFIPS